MLNTLIISKDINFAQALLDQGLNLHITNISTSTTMTYKSLSNRAPDIIFLDKAQVNSYSKTFLEKYNHIIIITSLEELTTSRNPELANKLKMLLDKDLDEKKRQIVKELETIGYNFKYNGTNYLANALLQAYLHQNDMQDNLQGFIYPIVAKDINKTVKAVKNGIINATEYMYRDCDINTLKEYFKLQDDLKPSVKQVIITIMNKIA